MGPLTGSDFGMEQIDESKTGMELLRDEEIMDSINPMNSTLVSYVNLPRIADDLIEWGSLFLVMVAFSCPT